MNVRAWSTALVLLIASTLPTVAPAATAAEGLGASPIAAAPIAGDDLAAFVRATRDGRGTAGAAPVIDTTRISRQELLVAGYADACQDAGGGRLDLMEMAIVESTDDAALLFVAEFCAAVDQTAFGTDGSLIWILRMPGGNPSGDYAIMLVWDPVEEWATVVIRTPTPSPSTWSIVGSWGGAQFDDHTVVAFVPSDAIGGHRTFAFVSSATDNSKRRDNLPEAHEGWLDFPESCALAILGRAEVLVVPERHTTAVAAARGGGYTVGVEVPEIGLFEVVGLVDSQLSRLGAVTGARSVQRPALLRRQAVVPNDPGFARQWGLHRINAPAAWTQTTGSGLTVAVIDDGVDGTHPDLAERVLAGHDTRFDRPIAASTDSSRGGHGTAVAGILAATGGNSAFLAGLDWTARIQPYRVFDAAGCTTSVAVASAVTRAAEARVAVANLSLGGPDTTDGMEAAIRYALERDVVVVAASGNHAEDGNEPMYPAAYPGVVAVGATEQRGDRIASYSATGAHVALVAPGGADDAGIAILGQRGAIDEGSGTSFAAPLVSAAAALYRSLDPRARQADVVAKLLETARDLGPAGRDDVFGHGMLDVAALLAAVGPRVEQLRAAGNVATAIALSAAAYPDGAEIVLLARDDDFADALAAGAVAGVQRAVLLLTPSEHLDTGVRAEIERLGAGRVVILGGTRAVSPGVEAELAATSGPSGPLHVERIAGSGRAETAAAVASRFLPRATEALLTRGWGDADPTRGFADALGAGAAAAIRKTPVLLTAPSQLPPITMAHLKAAGIRSVTIVGGTGAVSADVEAQLRAAGLDVRRIFGVDRFDTARRLAADTVRADEVERVVLVDGGRSDTWAAGLAAAAYAGRHRAPLLLTANENAPAPTRSYLTAADKLRILLAAPGVDPLAAEASAESSRP